MYNIVRNTKAEQIRNVVRASVTPYRKSTSRKSGAIKVHRYKSEEDDEEADPSRPPG